jgi:hypothetical protein
MQIVFFFFINMQILKATLGCRKLLTSHVSTWPVAYLDLCGLMGSLVPPFPFGRGES